MSAKKVAFQMDPLETLNLERDTSLLLIQEALNRGLDVYHYEPRHLSMLNGKVIAQVALITPQSGAMPYSLGPRHSISLDEMDFIWIRQDPPYDMAYITCTYLLERVAPKVRILNHPTGLRDAPEKLLITSFPELMPPTLITRDLAQAQAFMQEIGQVIVKPLYEYSGHFITVPTDADHLASLFAAEDERQHGLPLMIQKFLPEIKHGDKRVFVIDGVPYGCFHKVPSGHAYLSNLAYGGKTIPAELTEVEYKACERLKPTLQKLGLYFVGLDVIGNYVTEINVTSPTGVPTFNRLYGEQLEKRLWDGLLGPAPSH